MPSLSTRHSRPSTSVRRRPRHRQGAASHRGAQSRRSIERDLVDGERHPLHELTTSSRSRHPLSSRARRGAAARRPRSSGSTADPGGQSRRGYYADDSAPRQSRLRRARGQQPRLVGLRQDLLPPRRQAARRRRPKGQRRGAQLPRRHSTGSTASRVGIIGGSYGGYMVLRRPRVPRPRRSTSGINIFGVNESLSGRGNPRRCRRGLFSSPCADVPDSPWPGSGSRLRKRRAERNSSARPSRSSDNKPAARHRPTPRRRRRLRHPCQGKWRVIGGNRDGLRRAWPHDCAARRIRQLQAEALVAFLLIVVDDLEFDELGLRILVTPGNRHGIGDEILARRGRACDRLSR